MFPSPNKQARASERLSPGARQSFKEFLRSNRENSHIARLVQALALDQVDLAQLFEYGLRHAPANTDAEPDLATSSYFYLLSEIEALPEPARDFAIDMMLYCEGAYAYSHWYRSFNGRREYARSIEPLLKRSGSTS